MGHIESFNVLLNTTEDDRYSRWIEFRKEIDSILLREINRLNSKELAVLIGAGRCEEFSLKQFVDQFKKVVISDVDVESILNSTEYKMLSETDKTKVEIVRVEYTGLENNGLFDNLENKIRQCKSFEELESMLDKSFRGLEKYSFLKKYEADFVYVSPIYTQLIYQQVLLVVSKLRSTGHMENFLKFVENYTSDKLVKLFERFNENIARISKGTLVVASDIFQDYTNSTFMKNLKKDFSKEKTDRIYRKYYEEYGFGMGDLGLYILNGIIPLTSYEWLIWPFVEGSEMVVKLAIYNK